MSLHRLWKDKFNSFINYIQLGRSNIIPLWGSYPFSFISTWHVVVVFLHMISHILACFSNVAWYHFMSCLHSCFPCCLWILLVSSNNCRKGPLTRLVHLFPHECGLKQATERWLQNLVQQNLHRLHAEPCGNRLVAAAAVAHLCSGVWMQLENEKC